MRAKTIAIASAAFLSGTIIMRKIDSDIYQLATECLITRLFYGFGNEERIDKAMKVWKGDVENLKVPCLLHYLLGIDRGKL